MVWLLKLKLNVNGADIGSGMRRYEVKSNFSENLNVIYAVGRYI